MSAPSRVPGAAPPSAAETPSARLRAAGLSVTSARLAALRLAPTVLRAHGRLTPCGLHQAASAAGYTISPSAWYPVLARLHAAGLLPAAPSPARAPPRRAAPLPSSDVPDSADAR